MKKMWIFLLSCGMILAVAKPTVAGSNNFWPGFAAGVGAAVVVGAIMAAPEVFRTNPPCAPPPRVAYPCAPLGDVPYRRPHRFAGPSGYWRVIHDPYRGSYRVWVNGYGAGVPGAIE